MSINAFLGILHNGKIAFNFTQEKRKYMFINDLKYIFSKVTSDIIDNDRLLLGT